MPGFSPQPGGDGPPARDQTPARVGVARRRQRRSRHRAAVSPATGRRRILDRHPHYRRLREPKGAGEMILRYDRLGLEIPAGDPDPAGAAAVQELMGGRFCEMSTFMNYTFQSFSFRGRQALRPFYDLIANIAAEEYGHIEAVGAAITTMWTGADARRIIAEGSAAHALVSGKGVLPVDSGGAP
jgi:hypothetical protein